MIYIYIMKNFKIQDKKKIYPNGTSCKIRTIKALRNFFYFTVNDIVEMVNEFEETKEDGEQLMIRGLSDMYRTIKGFENYEVNVEDLEDYFSNKAHNIHKFTAFSEIQIYKKST